MAEEKIFVGRKDELKQFGEVLKEPKGQAVLVVGQAGMGKTWLVNEFAEIAKDPDDGGLRCGAIRYEVTPTDSVDSTMALMMDNAFDAAQVKEGSFDGTERRLEQWRAFLNVFNLGDLVLSLRRDPVKNTREQFLERLRRISNKMPANGRAIFIVDPEKYMQEKSDQAWAIVVRDLPEKIKLIFAQRPEDVLVKSGVFKGLANVVYIPKSKLGVLKEENVEKLVRLRAGEVRKPADVLQETMKQYKGHPYAIQAALDLLGKGVGIEKLPQDPTDEQIAEAQWDQVCESGEDAMRLFEAYAVLEVGVPESIVEAVSGLGGTTRKRLQKDKYLGGLLREEGEGRRIYHAILADYILGQIGEEERKEYHKRAVGVYREKLRKAREEQTRPDGLSAERLAEHILAAEGKEAFLDAFVNECYPALSNLGLLDAAMNLSERALGMVKESSGDEAIIRGNLGLIYQTRGELEKAEEMHKRSLEIEKKLGRLEGMASDYGNLGLIYQTRGELNEAEKMYHKVLEIEKKLGHPDSIAKAYGNLGLIYMDKGELEKAEEIHRKALEIHKKLGNQEGIAKDYGNLGLIYQRRGELDKAEEMHRKSLEIEKKLGRLEGMASEYGNLGVIYKTKGELDKAEEMHKRSLEIAESIGNQEIIASDYGNLGVIYKARGELDKAEEMYRKALEIDEKLGRLEKIAIRYGNLGLIYEERGDVKKAREYWEKAVELYKRIGMPHMVELVEGWIEGSPR